MDVKILEQEYAIAVNTLKEIKDYGWGGHCIACGMNDCCAIGCSIIVSKTLEELGI